MTKHLWVTERSPARPILITIVVKACEGRSNFLLVKRMEISGLGEDLIFQRPVTWLKAPLRKVDPLSENAKQEGGAIISLMK